ncbi:phospholipase A2 inhibitor NAI-like [Malaclemys terrapin pileata]|uniref:phospholipase A2 inhibitor NAI-like n=1 Tax=Malaclemys terrapin pileata TaxID=2991368 RepID=UPI0023A83C8F|nr:phospholipase A2 inhibitor NAI-like [Malaclemys terrapin pileata]
MRASLAAFILAALLATGACLQCEVCGGPGTTCSGDLQTCPAGLDSCGILLSEDTEVPRERQRINKTCLTSRECKLGYVSLKFWNGKTLRFQKFCCVGDACRTTTFKLPPADTKPNGRSCRGCIFSFPGPCMEGTIECTGAETQCYYSTQKRGTWWR